MISVIIPVFNTESYLSRCIQSVVNSTFRDIEIIVVDDGSTDRSGIIADKWAKKDSRVKVIHKENQGVSLSRKLGVSLAQGEWISFVDSDDYISPDLLGALYSIVSKNDVEVSCCDFVTAGQGADANFDGACSVHVLDREIALAHMFIHKDLTFSVLCAKLIRKSLLVSVDFPDQPRGEDCDVMLQIYHSVKSIGYTASKMYCWFQRSDSATHTFTEDAALDFEVFEREMYRLADDPDLQVYLCERAWKRLMMTLDCARTAAVTTGFRESMRSAYQKCLMSCMPKVKIGPLEKKLLQLDWTEEGGHPIAKTYLRLKIANRNRSFLSSHVIN